MTPGKKRTRPEMNESSYRLTSSKRHTRASDGTARAIVLGVLLVILLSHGIHASPDTAAITSRAKSHTTKGGGFDCGYDPRGAEDEVYAHLSALKSKARLSVPSAAEVTSATSLGPRADNVDGVAVIQDDGTIVVPPNNFNLKKRSLLFMPDGSGYRIERADIKFQTDRGSKLRDFLGADGKPGSGNNGYREVALLGA